jgi:hypothetical protein
MTGWIMAAFVLQFLLLICVGAHAWDASDRAKDCLRQLDALQFNVLNTWGHKLHEQQVADTKRIIEEFVKWIPPGKEAPDTDTLNALRTIELLAFNATKKHQTKEK